MLMTSLATLILYGTSLARWMRPVLAFSLDLARRAPLHAIGLARRCTVHTGNQTRWSGMQRAWLKGMQATKRPPNVCTIIFFIRSAGMSATLAPEEVRRRVGRPAGKVTATVRRRRDQRDSRGEKVGRRLGLGDNRMTGNRAGGPRGDNLQSQACPFLLLKPLAL
jgi:hypothetical protein